MSIEQQLTEDMKLAMKEGRKTELDTIRLLRAQLKSAAIEKKSDLDDIEQVQVLQREAKRRKESIEAYQKGNRQDLVDKEMAELDLITRYLPEQLSESEIDKIVQEEIKKLQVTSMKDMGRIMGSIMPKLRGKADGRAVQKKVQSFLSDLSK
jgi:uncharacterized protein YqeY